MEGKRTCLKCNHVWLPRVSQPLKCPKCGTLYYKEGGARLNAIQEESFKLTPPE